MNLNSYTIDLREKTEMMSGNFIVDLRKQVSKNKAQVKTRSGHNNFFSGILPVFSKKAFAAVIILAMVVMPLLNITAYEAHVINVTAKIANDIPDIDPSGGEYCDVTTVPVVMSTTFPGANIIYTLDGTDPVCPMDTLSEYNYSLPFNLIINASTTVKARTCHDGAQSAIARVDFITNPELCFSYCGDGDLDAGEECDDGNNINGDGCSSDCQTEEEECVPEPEICDLFDNDCDGIIDNNIFRDAEASGTPFQANLEDGTDVTEEVELSDNIYAIQDAYPHTRYIYLWWQFPEIPDDASTTEAELLIEHHENKVSLVIQWKMPDNTWIEVCNPPESKRDVDYTCNLTPYLNTAAKAQDVNLRLQMICLDDCEEYLDFAWLNIKYREAYECPVCGNGLVENGYPAASSTDEECDDGNLTDNDGCSSACTLETGNCLKINEVYSYPGTRVTPNGKTEKDPRDEWLELYNACPFGINIKNWYLENSEEAELLNHNYPIAANQYVVIAANASTWKFWPNIPDNAYKIALGGKKLFDGLNDQGDHLFLYDNHDNLIDTVSWGFDKSAFDPPVPSVAMGHSISRKPAGFDTDKASDWMDTWSGSTPPGPNPGTNPHDKDDNLLLTEIEAVTSPEMEDPVKLNEGDSDGAANTFSGENEDDNQASGNSNNTQPEINNGTDNSEVTDNATMPVAEETDNLNNSETENSGADNPERLTDVGEATDEPAGDNAPVGNTDENDASGILPDEPADLPSDNSGNTPPDDTDNEEQPATLPETPADTVTTVTITVSGE